MGAQRVKRERGGRGSASEHSWGAFIRNTIGSLLLIVLCPPTAFFLCYTALHEGGSIASMLSMCVGVARSEGPAALYRTVMGQFLWGNEMSWCLLASFVALQAGLMLVLPGRRAHAPPTPRGDIVPPYTLNGLWSFIVTIAVFEACSLQRASVCNYVPGARLLFRALVGGDSLAGPVLFNGEVLYDNLMELIGTATVFTFAVCAALFVKGRLAPSGRDLSDSSNPVFQFYWGAELYPRVTIAGSVLHLKLLFHSRIGMTLWALLNISYMHAQHEALGYITNAMVLNVVLQLVYIAHHHWWEEGYIHTTDIVHDYEGFYLVYGCVVFMPFTFTLSGITLVLSDLAWPWTHAALICVASIMFSAINFDADGQKLRVRQSGGRCSVWGRPASFIKAKYERKVDGKSESKSSLLLTCGWWSVARHLHYLADIGGVFAWTLPAGTPWERPLIYFYWAFLVVLFIDRAQRDEQRCAAKYGAYWEQYCRAVPYKIVPFVW